MSESTPAKSEALDQPVPLSRELGAVVLCGGRSRRMGMDKARARLGEQSLLERAVQTLGVYSDWIGLACGASPRYRELGLPLLLDRVEGEGPLAGLRAAIAGCPAELVLVLACDLPAVEPAMLGLLLETARRDELDLCLFERDGRPEPLCAVYSRSCLQAIELALAAGERKATAFWTRPTGDGRALAIRLLPSGERESRGLANVNTPADLERVRQGESTR